MIERTALPAKTPLIDIDLKLVYLIARSLVRRVTLRQSALHTYSTGAR
ncbi:hypothetical protein [Methylocaldum sp.]|nr:hypothetical protein [Methylocaldum sp.]HYE36413.1 hypothetical protein [Methylocaldum sp.]